MAYNKLKFPARLWNRVIYKDTGPNCCWITDIHMSGTYTSARPYMRYNSRKCPASWVAYILAYPEDKDKLFNNANIFVLHTCDNPLCIRPDHLFLGTQNENMQDMKVKGRYVKAKRTSSYKKIVYSEVK